MENNEYKPHPRNASRWFKVPKKRRTSKKKSAATGRITAARKTVDRKFHEFMTAWKDHVHDEISIHKKILQGKTTLKQHLRDTIQIQEDFLRRMRKMI